MSIKNVILHEVTRENDGEMVVKNLRDVENSTAGLGEKLTEQLIELFSQSTLNIGEFGVNGDATIEPAFEQHLKKLHEKKATFVEATKAMATSFAAIIEDPKLQTVKGGILAFYVYEYKGSTLLAVTVLNRIDGINASEKLDLSSSTIIDLNRLHLGASINISDWQNGFSTRYIKFKTGRSVEMRDYFESFIGCQRDKQAALRETTALKNAIKSYSTGLKLDNDAMQSKLDTAHSFIQEQQKLGKEVLLTHVANAVFPGSTKEFLDVARGDEYQLSEQLAISPTELKRYVRLSGRGKGVAISFDNELLGKTVTYNNGQLTFDEIPHSLKQSILELQREEQND